MKRCRHIRRTRRCTTMTQPAPVAAVRIMRWSRWRPSGSSTSAVVRWTHWSRYRSRSEWIFQRIGFPSCGGARRPVRERLPRPVRGRVGAAPGRPGGRGRGCVRTRCPPPGRASGRRRGHPREVAAGGEDQPESGVAVDLPARVGGGRGGGTDLGNLTRPPHQRRPETGPVRRLAALVSFDGQFVHGAVFARPLVVGGHGYPVDGVVAGDVGEAEGQPGGPRRVVVGFGGEVETPASPGGGLLV